ncbi:hypothetical protein MPSEU_000814700 [Mayamaea pseudoterrestris]|nr:hypothetical protein MPSEU_000814700 [Mayamaea pseudoterrestris]
MTKQRSISGRWALCGSILIISTLLLCRTEQSFPPLSTLINESKIIADVSFLLDFAIIGHPKTGTTFLAQWLGAHTEINSNLTGAERHYLTKRQPAKMVKYLHAQPKNQLRAYKAPRDVCHSVVVESLAKYFSSAKLIIGLRHPIDLFESFYNYRVARNWTMPPPESLIGRCMYSMKTDHEKIMRVEELGGLRDQGVCTDVTDFHVNLSHLQKTRQYENETKYKELLGKSSLRQRPDIDVPNPIFVYEIRQLANSSATFRNDLTNFLGLHQPLGKPDIDPVASNVYDHVNVDICDPRYRLVRRELLANGKNAAKWIKQYLMDAPGVTMSEKSVFAGYLNDWKKDPCLRGRLEVSTE